MEAAVRRTSAFLWLERMAASITFLEMEDELNLQQDTTETRNLLDEDRG